MAKDLVFNMNVDEKTAKHTSEAKNGDKIYLCSSACKQQFEHNPSKYGY
jgi:YHS domain-containing protein